MSHSFLSLTCVNWYCRCLWPSTQSPQTSRFPLGDLVPQTSLKTPCGEGFGLAACPSLGLLVTSDYDSNDLSVWGLPSGAGGGGGASGGAGASAGAGARGASPGGGGGLPLVCTLGGAGSAAPMQFKFTGKDTGYLAFTPATTTTSGSSSTSARPLLLVTDHGHDAVHLVDVVGQTHAGYLAPPASIAGPRGVAASGTSPLVAVSAWKDNGSGDHVVVVYRSSHGGAVWETVRVIGGGLGGPGRADGQLNRPWGLRFSGDGCGICVADFGNGRASVLRVGDGGFVRHIATGLRCPMDVEEVEGGWLVACYYLHRVELVCVGDGGFGGGWPSVGKAGGRPGIRDEEFGSPTALAVVSALGLVVREYGNRRLQVFATPDAIAMAAMSPDRVAWMTAVARAVLRRQGLMWQRGVAVGDSGRPNLKRARAEGKGGPL
jgi:hypothetical protein